MRSWIIAAAAAWCTIACGCQTTVEGFLLPVYGADPSSGVPTAECSLVLVPEKGPKAYELWIADDCTFVAVEESIRLTPGLLLCPDDRLPDPQTIYRARGKVAGGEGLKLDLPGAGPRTVIQLHINHLEAVGRTGPVRVMRRFSPL